MIIGIVGLGLMGGSFAMTVKKRTSALVYGFDKDPEVLKKAIERGIIDGDLAGRENEADMLLIALYPRVFAKIAEEYLPKMKRGATLTDICGIKRTVIKDMRRLAVKYPDINFVGGHAMAGREYSGIDNATDSLFSGASMILVPVNADGGVMTQIKEFFLSLGFGETVVTDAETHDANIAFTSQLPHAVSNAFIKSPTAKRHFGYSAGSYKDLTRVARLQPEMWTQLMADNSDMLASELDILIENLKKYSEALKAGDEERLKGLLAEGNERKKKIDEDNYR